tara:strand:+ start:628 stop:954 length:327 start_codon:yes stop_codon:yes gene_type:complete
MKIKIKYFSILLLSLFLLNSCGGSAKDVLQGKKRSDSKDEFLVKKKNPLTLPPDFSKLPLPNESEEREFEVENENELKKILKIEDNSSVVSNDSSGSSLEDLIIERIK